MDFLAELFVFLMAALVAVPILKRLGVSSVIGYLVAGLMIGPSGMELVGNASETLHFAEIGVVLLLFIIGLELQPRRLWVMRKVVFGLGASQVVLLTVAIGGLLWLFALELTAAATIGFALALSSTAFVLQLLGERKELNHSHGRSAFGVLLFQDIAVIPAIVILTALGGSGDGQHTLSWLALAAVVLLIIAARYLLKPMLRWVANTGIHELFIAASLAIVTGAALAMYTAGLSMGLGAFIAGMLVADSEFRHQMETDVMPFKGLLLGLFFMAVGMSVDVGLLVDMPLLIIGLTVALVAVKALVFLPVVRAFGERWDTSWRTTLVLSQGGEFAFVLLTTAVSSALIAPEIMDIAVLVVTLSMTSTPFLILAYDALNKQDDDRPYDEVEAPERPVIIAGFGRFGQIIGRILTAQGRKFTALEANPGQVDIVREFGNEVYFGDATRLDLLQSAGIREARAVVLAMDDMELSVHLAATLKEMYPDVPILARARNRQHEIKLRDLGVHYVIRETLLSSLELARNLAPIIDMAPAAVDAFAKHDEQALLRQAAVIHDENAFRQSVRDAADELKTLFADDLSDADVQQKP